MIVEAPPLEIGIHGVDARLYTVYVPNLLSKILMVNLCLPYVLFQTVQRELEVEEGRLTSLGNTTLMLQVLPSFSSLIGVFVKI
jgi:hypothetical protein